MELIQSLPLGYRTVFNLFAIEGYSHQEIGELLGITESTSKSQLNRARSVLKEKITSLQLQTKITHG
jgi:RNA polymerase sigma-70 factor (ECF subfamily)